ncbi:MAG: ATP synthase F1 subunit epsilon [Prolixibacteraceae bacterium]|jgi:F-type H+-transporting ATPase subunit epsilon
MYIEIITPDKRLYTGEVHRVKLPGTQGYFEILNNHAPIISTLEKGQIKVTDVDNKITLIDITGGLVEAKNNKIVVLAENQ